MPPREEKPCPLKQICAFKQQQSALEIELPCGLMQKNLQFFVDLFVGVDVVAKL